MKKIMKKFFSYAGIILLLAVVIAVFTSTGKEQCKKYVADKLTPGGYVNLQVSEAPVKIFGAKFVSTISLLITNHQAYRCSNSKLA